MSDITAIGAPDPSPCSKLAECIADLSWIYGRMETDYLQAADSDDFEVTSAATLMHRIKEITQILVSLADDVAVASPPAPPMSSCPACGCTL